jgi:hypothetical protein
MRYRVLRPFRAGGQEFDGRNNNILPPEAKNWRSLRSLLNTRRIATIDDAEAEAIERERAERVQRQQPAEAAPAASDTTEGTANGGTAPAKPSPPPRRHHPTQAELRQKVIAKGAR